jgi:hypothetical protein
MSNVWDWLVAVERAQRDGHLTTGYEKVLRKLVTFRGHGGDIHPSHATLADRAGVGERTVRRALEAGRELGLLSWTPRRVRVGWRSLRSSNRYRLERPQKPLEAVPGRRRPYVRQERAGAARSLIARLCTGGQIGRRDDKQEGRGLRSLAPHPPVRTVAEQIALLLR